MSSHEIHRLLHEYGLAIVFVAVGLQALGAPIPGTTVLIAAAVYAAAAHGLPIAGVIAAGVLGALAGTCAGFAIGRWGGERLLIRVGRLARQPPERVQLIRRELAQRGAPWLFIARFITGGRNIAGLAAGASGMGVARFVAVSAAAATVWSLVNALEYYFFGHALAGASTWVQAGLIAAGIAWLVVSVWLLRRRVLRRVAAATAGRAGEPAGAPRGPARCETDRPAPGAAGSAAPLADGEVLGQGDLLG
jgi:membrane protein DedA with SNARE-associated domain